MSLPDFTPRLMELQAKVQRLTHDRELLIDALEGVIDLEGDDRIAFAIRHAVETLARVRREDNFIN
jgi:hypothetical protein